MCRGQSSSGRKGSGSLVIPKLDIVSESNSGSSLDGPGIKWVEHKGSYYPFSEDGGRNMVEFSLEGTVAKAYLLKNSNGYTHNVTVKLDEDEIEKIKAVASKAPNCKNGGQYRWLFMGSNAKFS